MAKKAKRRGTARTTRPATLVGLRCHQPFLSAVDAWRERRDDRPTRAAAIMRLVELGLSVASPRGRVSERSASKASAMAGKEIDRLSDRSAPAAVRAKRKRRLIGGPREFRAFRKDRPNKPKNNPPRRPRGAARLARTPRPK